MDVQSRNTHADNDAYNQEEWPEGFAGILRLFALCFTPSDDVIDFFAPWLPLLINATISLWTTSRMQEPTWEVSFWGLFWIPYHPDIPLQIATSVLLASVVQAVLSVLSPNFPRALQAYSRDGRARLPFKAHKLSQRHNNPTFNLVAMAIFVGILLNRLLGSGLLQPLIGLVFYTLLACCIIYPILRALYAFWSAVRSYPGRPPLGTVTGLQWPPESSPRRLLWGTCALIMDLFQDDRADEAEE